MYTDYVDTYVFKDHVHKDIWTRVLYTPNLTLRQLKRDIFALELKERRRLDVERHMFNHILQSDHRASLRNKFPVPHIVRKKQSDTNDKVNTLVS